MICDNHKLTLRRLEVSQRRDKNYRNRLNVKASLNREELKAVNAAIGWRHCRLMEINIHDSFGHGCGLCTVIRLYSNKEIICLASSMEERLPRKQEVVGSSPAHGSISA